MFCVFENHLKIHCSTQGQKKSRSTYMIVIDNSPMLAQCHFDTQIYSEKSDLRALPKTSHHFRLIWHRLTDPFSELKLVKGR